MVIHFAFLWSTYILVTFSVFKQYVRERVPSFPITPVSIYFDNPQLFYLTHSLILLFRH